MGELLKESFLNIYQSKIFSALMITNKKEGHALFSHQPKSRYEEYLLLAKSTGLALFLFVLKTVFVAPSKI
ncbi:MAG: hypothetical protein QW666_00430 [Candidatus Woesearchaeota archaeon]